MKLYYKHLIKERGINWWIAVKAMYLAHSEGLFSLYDRLQMSKGYKKDADYVLYDLSWQLSSIKDFAQYQY